MNMNENNIINDTYSNNIPSGIIAFFKNDFKNKMDAAVYGLLSYSLNQEKESLYKVRRFFHIINGTSSMLELIEISETAAYYETYLDNLLLKESISPEDYQKIITGLAKLDLLNTQIQLPKNIDG